MFSKKNTRVAPSPKVQNAEKLWDTKSKSERTSPVTTTDNMKKQTKVIEKTNDSNNNNNNTSIVPTKKNNISNIKKAIITFVTFIFIAGLIVLILYFVGVFDVLLKQMVN